MCKGASWGQLQGQHTTPQCGTLLGLSIMVHGAQTQVDIACNEGGMRSAVGQVMLSRWWPA